MNLRDFCYTFFGWAGRGLFKVFGGIEEDIDAAYMRVYPEVYLSIVSFVAFLSLGITFVVTQIFMIKLWNGQAILPFKGVFVYAFSGIIPLIVIVMGVLMPKTAASNRMSGLKIEIPYASMYISVMTSGGLSPYESLLRVRHMGLLPNMQKEVGRLETIVMSTGIDPITAMEQAANVVNMKDYKELLLGYASTVRTGGDTLHYLFNQTENMFKSLSIKIKGLGESMGMLMEAYTIVGILGVLGLFLIFVVGMSLPSAGISISSQQFFLFSFVGLPLLSVVFIYFSDASQISYPISNWKTLKVFGAFLPVGIFLASQMVLPYFDQSFLLFPPLNQLVILIRNLLNFAEGTEAAIGLSLTLIIVAIPGFVADQYFIGREGSIQHGITQFLRDLVETRKSGLSPERCINALSMRDYRAFSKHLKSINLKLNWGYPIKQIYQEFEERVRNWLALVNIYLLIDTIEVGGGTEKSLESLATFSQTAKQLEDEKRAVLMPLTIVPYIGAALLTATTVMFLQFFTGVSMGITIQYVTLYKTLLTPLALHSFILGLVTGKIVSGRVSAGFKHSIFMTFVSLAGLWAVSNVQMGMGF